MKFQQGPKSEAVLLREDARDEARQKVRTLTRRITDHIYVEIDRLFIDAEERGQAVTAIDVQDCIANAGPQIKRFLNEG